jgi:hypothetical protein
MVSPQRFDGPDLEAVLERVHTKLGPDARIVEANKVRSGGVGGFFSRERFEVFAEPALINVGPQTMAPSAAAMPTATPVAPAIPMPMPEPATNVADAPVTGARDLLELADLVSAVERRHTPQVSTETSSFADVLARVSAAAGDGADEPPMPTGSVLVDEGTPMTMTAPTMSTVYSAPPSAPPAANAPTTPISSMPTAPISSMPTPPISSVPTAPPVTPAPPTTSPDPIEFVMAPSSISSAEAPLHRLGLPDDLVPTVVAGRDLRADLIARLETLPAPALVPNAAGAVVVFVGDQGRALHAAQRHACEAGLTIDDVVLASPAPNDLPPWLVIDDPSTADGRRRSWWRRPRPTFVAIDDGPGRTTEWTEQMLAALEPTMVFGVAAAAMKPDDLAAWAGRLAVDAIELDELSLTLSPASALRTGIPVSRIDGTLADANAWADMLLSRLGA